MIKLLTKNWLLIAFVVLVVGNIAIFSLKNFKTVNKLQATNSVIVDSLNRTVDSLNRINFERHYLSKLVELNLTENNKFIDDNLLVYEILDSNKTAPKPLKSILRNGKRKLIVRYTEIGCNACADSTFRQIAAMERLREKYETIILVDFTSYEYYVKWRRLSEVQYPVWWLEKGKLPFEIEKENSSYIFTVGADLKPSAVFMPNSLFVKYLKSYLKSI